MIRHAFYTGQLATGDFSTAQHQAYFLERKINFLVSVPPLFWKWDPVWPSQENIDVLATLTALGYSASEAAKAVATLPPASDLSLEEKIRLALQYFGGK